MKQGKADSSQIKRLLIGIGGGIVLLVGILAIPYPGPGWLIVFAGLGILSTEFEWAGRVLTYAKKKYDRWQDWLKRQPAWLKALVWSLTAVIVVLTIYLLNGYGIINSLFNLGQDWLVSPLVK